MAPKLKLRTKEELNALLQFLDVVESRIFSKEGPDLLKSGEEWDQYPWFNQVCDIISQKSSSDYNEKLEVVKVLRDWAKGLEQVKLLLPFKPSSDFIEKVYAGVEESEPSGFILDIVVDKTITSGGRLFHRGRYVDLTLRSGIENLFTKEDVIGKYL